MLLPNLFTYFCKVEFTFSILPFIVDANKGKLRFYFDAPCLNAAEALLPRHSYAASTPFLQRFHAILTKPLFYPPKSLPNNYTNITQPKHIGFKRNSRCSSII